jgi:anti-sigma regulatory factor (Ser/Thr protein kinase)
VTRSQLHHEAFFFGDEEEYLAGVVPFLCAGLEAGEEVMVAVTAEKIELIEGALGADAAQIRFADMEELGRNPARIIPAWRDFVEDASGAGRGPRGIGEPIWPGRSEAEIDECRRHEALLNVAFAEGPRWSLLCPFDVRRLPLDLLDAACHAHDFVSGSRARSPSRPGGRSAYEREPFAGRLAQPPADAEQLAFGHDELRSVRVFSSRLAGELSFGGDRCMDAAAAVNELAGNSIVHGGGRGTVWGWEGDGRLIFQVSDAGRIADPLAGRRRPTIEQAHGRGLWMVNQLCDLVQIRSGIGGTSVRISFDVISGRRDPGLRSAGTTGV